MCLTRTNIWLLTSFFCYRGEELSDFKRFGWIPRDPTWLESAVSALVRVVKEILHDSRPQLRGVPVIFFLSTSVERMVSIIRYSKPVESNHLSEDMGLIPVMNFVIFIRQVIRACSNVSTVDTFFRKTVYIIVNK